MRNFVSRQADRCCSSLKFVTTRWPRWLGHTPRICVVLVWRPIGKSLEKEGQTRSTWRRTVMLELKEKNLFCDEGKTKVRDSVPHVPTRIKRIRMTAFEWIAPRQGLAWSFGADLWLLQVKSRIYRLINLCSFEASYIEPAAALPSLPAAVHRLGRLPGRWEERPPVSAGDARVALAPGGAEN